MASGTSPLGGALPEPDADPNDLWPFLRRKARWWALGFAGVSYAVLISVELLEPTAANLGVYLLLLAALTLVFHVLFIGLFPFTKRDWKIVDYVWLSVAGVGLVGASGEAGRLQAELNSGRARFDAIAEHAAAKSEASGDTTDFCDPRWPTRENSRAADFAETCAWFRLVAAALPDSITSDPPEQLFPGVPPPPRVDDPWAHERIREMLNSAARYEQALWRRAAAERNREAGALEMLFTLGGGFLLVFALALRLTKVTGELCLERAAPGTKRST